jgi:hypothetical protein
MRKKLLGRPPVCATVLILGVLFLVPTAGSAIPTCGCYCPGGSGTTIAQTTWGPSPYTCSYLASIGYDAAWQYANNQCSNGACGLTFSNESCMDSGLSTQHYDLLFTYKCQICLDPCP